MADLGFLFGALVITFLVSRGVRWVAFRQARGVKRVVGPNLLTLGISTVIGAFGMADGGPPPFGRAFLGYLLPVAIWTAVDAIRQRRVTSAPQSSP